MIFLSAPASDLAHENEPNSGKLKALQEAITQGFASGTAGQLDMQAIKQKAKQQAGLSP